MSELVSLTPARADGMPGWPHRRLRGLLTLELQAHGRRLQLCWMLWLAFGLVLPVFCNPSAVLIAGMVYGMTLAPNIGGRDAIEGVEEFTLALPATRADLYWVRAAVGLGPLYLLLALSLSAIALDAPGRLWSLVADSGFAVPFAHFPTSLYIYAALLPAAFASCTFTAALLARGPRAANHGVSIGLLSCGAALAIGSMAEYRLWHRYTGLIAGPLFAALIAAAVWHGRRAFARKEYASQPNFADRFGRWVVWLVVVPAVIAIILGFVAVG